MKWLGALLIVGTLGGSGWLYAGRFDRRIKELEDWRQALCWCEMEMNYNLLPLAEVLSLVGQRLGGPVGTMLQQCARGMTDERLPMQMSWRRALAEYMQTSTIGEENALILLRFGSSLGSSDLKQQNNNLKFTCANLDQALNRAKREKAAKAKIYRYLGFCAGLALVMILF